MARNITVNALVGVNQLGQLLAPLERIPNTFNAVNKAAGQLSFGFGPEVVNQAQKITLSMDQYANSIKQTITTTKLLADGQTKVISTQSAWLGNVRDMISTSNQLAGALENQIGNTRTLAVEEDAINAKYKETIALREQLTRASVATQQLDAANVRVQNATVANNRAGAALGAESPAVFAAANAELNAAIINEAEIRANNAPIIEEGIVAQRSATAEFLQAENNLSKELTAARAAAAQYADSLAIGAKTQAYADARLAKPQFTPAIAQIVSQSTPTARVLAQAGLGAGPAGSSLGENLASQGAFETFQIEKDLTREVTRVSGSFRDQAGVLNTLNLEYDKAGNIITRFGSRMSGIGSALSQLGRDFQKVAEFAIATTAIFGAFNVANQAIATINDLDKSLRQFAITAQISRSEAKNLFEGLADVAFRTATPLKEVVSAADDIALATRKAGQSTAEWQANILSLTEAVGILTNLAGIDTVRATDLLTSTMKQLGIQADQVVGILDKITAVAGGQSGAIGDIVTALGNLAEAGKDAGLSVDELIGLSQVLSQVTPKSPAEIAVSVKNLIGSLDSPGAKKIFDEFKISLKETEDGVVRTKNIIEVYTDIANKIASGIIPQDRIQDVLRGIAGGPRRIPDAAALLANIQQVELVTERSKRATNEAIVANAKLLDSTQAKLTQLGVLFDKFAFTKFADALNDAAGNLADVLKPLIAFLESVPTGAFTFILQLGGLLVIFKALSAGAGLVIGTLRNTAESLGLLKPASELASAATKLQAQQFLDEAIAAETDAQKIAQLTIAKNALAESIASDSALIGESTLGQTAAATGAAAALSGASRESLLSKLGVVPIEPIKISTDGAVAAATGQKAATGFLSGLSSKLPGLKSLGIGLVLPVVIAAGTYAATQQPQGQGGGILGTGIDPSAVGNALTTAGTLGLFTPASLTPAIIGGPGGIGVVAAIKAASIGAIALGFALSAMGNSAKATGADLATNTAEMLNAIQAYKDASLTLKPLTDLQQTLGTTIASQENQHKTSADAVAGLADNYKSYADVSLQVIDTQTQLNEAFGKIIDTAPKLKDAFGNVLDSIKAGGIITTQQLTDITQALSGEILAASNPDLATNKLIFPTRDQLLGNRGQVTSSTTVGIPAPPAETDVAASYAAAGDLLNQPGFVPGTSVIPTPTFDLTALKTAPDLISKLFDKAGNLIVNASDLSVTNLDLIRNALNDVNNKVDPTLLDKYKESFANAASSASNLAAQVQAIAANQAYLQAGGLTGLFTPETVDNGQKILSLYDSITKNQGSLPDQPTSRLQSRFGEAPDVTGKAQLDQITKQLFNDQGKLILQDGQFTGVTKDVADAMAEVYLREHGFNDEQLRGAGRAAYLKDALVHLQVSVKGYTDADIAAAAATDALATAQENLQSSLDSVEQSIIDKMLKLRTDFQAGIINEATLNKGIDALSRYRDIIVNIGGAFTNSLSNPNFSNALTAIQPKFSKIIGLENAAKLTTDQFIAKLLGLADAYGLNGKQLTKYAELLTNFKKLVDLLGTITVPVGVTLDKKSIEDAIRALILVTKAQAIATHFVSPDYESQLHNLESLLQVVENLDTNESAIGKLLQSGSGTPIGSTPSGGGTKTGTSLDVSQIFLSAEQQKLFSDPSAIVKQAYQDALKLQSQIPGEKTKDKNDIVTVFDGLDRIFKERGVSEELMRQALDRLTSQLQANDKADTIRRIRVGSGDFSAIANVPVNSQTGVSVGDTNNISVTLNLTGTLTPAEMDILANKIAASIARNISK